MADEGGEVASVAGDRGMAISDADADVLIAEAVRRREEQQSGRSMRRQLRRVAAYAVAGLLLVAGGTFLSYAVPVVMVIAIVAGVLLIAVAGLLLLRALDSSPAAQWGDPAAEPCPACSERSLREDRVAVPEANGIVALCTPECGYAEVRPDPDGPPEPGAGASPGVAFPSPAPGY